MAYKNLNSSKVLFSSDGCAKIGMSINWTSKCQLNKCALAHFGQCQSTQLALARPLGIIALEMMQNGISPTNEKLILKDPGSWSAEASNFLDVASWATLTEMHDVRQRFESIVKCSDLI